MCKSEAEVRLIIEDCTRVVLLKLTTDRHKVSRGLSATAWGLNTCGSNNIGLFNHKHFIPHAACIRDNMFERCPSRAVLSLPCRASRCMGYKNCLRSSSLPFITSSSAVAKRPLDASCLSVVSFNSTKRRVESFIVSYISYRFVTACS